MNFTEALMALELVLESGGVPLLIGESGIGKTALINRLCKNSGYYNITIDGNMLKEGEIGGLPTIEEYTTISDGKEIRKKKTVYAVHTKLQEIDEVKMEDRNKKILLFIDELNRCEHAVQQELMNIILNREINGYNLPEDVKVAAAMNPSNKYSSFNQSEYQVIDMDPAQENRFVWIELESDVKSWISWGIDTGIHEDVLSFISSFPDYLHTPYSQESIKATPRSWERISSAYKVYIRDVKKIPQKIFYNVVKGNVGPSIAHEFCNFIENSKSPLLLPEKILSSGTISAEIKDAIKGESHTRLYHLALNMLKYINKLERRCTEIRTICQLLRLYPSDLSMGIMKEIKENYHDTLYREFLEEDDFSDTFFSLFGVQEG